MNTLIIGGTSGFGAEYASCVHENTNCLLEATGRELDLGCGDWLSKLGTLVEEEFLGPSGIDHLVIAAYDRKKEHENVQLSAARALWPLFKDFTKTTFTLIGDVCHHFDATSSLYAANKRALYLQSLEWARTPHACHLVMFEPGIMENRATRGMPYLDWEEAVEALDNVAARERRVYSHIAFVGNNFLLDKIPGLTP